MYEVSIFPISATKLSPMVVNGGFTINVAFLLFLCRAFAKSLILM